MTSPLPVPPVIMPYDVLPKSASLAAGRERQDTPRCAAAPCPARRPRGPTRAWAWRSGASECGRRLKAGVRCTTPRILSMFRSRTSSFKRAALERGEERLLLARGPRHQQLVAGLHLRHGVPPAEPVGHHQPVEAPVVPQDAREQLGALRGVGAVQLVVGGHHRPRPGLADGDLEAAQVDLAQRPLGDLDVDGVAVPLVVVGGEVLRTRSRRPATGRPSRSAAAIRPATSGSSEKYSKFRPPRGLRWVLRAGPSSTSTPYSRVSFPIARPTGSTRSVSQDDASRVAIGKAVQ